jgi:hypothetical protein
MWTVFAGLSAVLIVGAVNRTNSKSDQVDGAQTPRNLQAAEGRQNATGNTEPLRQGGNGRNQGQKASAQTKLSSSADAEFNDNDWISMTASVLEVDEAALTLEQEDGSLLVIEGRAWRYALESGFNIETGSVVLVSGFYEDGEFKPGTLEDLTRTQSVVLRQASGKPMWAGGGNGFRVVPTLK